VPIPVDPGEVVVSASAPQRRPFEATVHVEEAEQRTVEVPVLPADAAPPPTDHPVDPNVPPTGGSVQRPIAVAVGAAGLVALGVGSYFGLHAISKWNDANAVCPSSTCGDPAGVNLAHDAKQAALVSDVLLGAGVVALAVGVVLWVTGAPKAVSVKAGTVAVTF
jgi:hypothetical protein